MHRPVQRLTRTLICAAAVPVMLVVSGCSSDSGSSSGSGSATGDDAKAGASASVSSRGSGGNSPASVQEAAYAKLPDPCSALSKKTLDDLVPESKKGKAGQSDDVGTRSNCSWSSLENNGVKGSQFRWLNVSLLRFDSSAARGSGEKLASEYFAKQVRDAQAVPEAKNTKSAPVSGAGSEATAVRYDLKKKEGTFKQQTVVARMENVVVTLDYNGAGLAGDKTPNADDLTKLAEKAVKETVSAVSAANGEGGGVGGGQAGEAGEASPGKSASPGTSASPSRSTSSGKGANPGESASPSTSASASATKSS